MVKIQIQNGYLNVKDSSNFPITFKVSDIRDLSSRKGTFSKTITLVGDSNNNQLLGHLYDVNIQTGTFDINKLTRCTVIQDELPIVEDAYLQLIAVNKLQSTTNFEQDVEYSVIVKDSQSDFFTKLGSAELTDLDFSDFDHTLNSTNIIDSFSNTDKYKYILPYAPLDTYPLKEFKPAIFAKEYFDRIFARAGFSYSWATIASERFERLLIPFNGDVNNIDYTPYNVIFNKTLNFGSLYPTTITNNWINQNLSNVTQTQDNFNLFNPTTGVYNSPFNLSAGDSINLTIPINYTISFNNTTGLNLTPLAFITHRLKIRIFKNATLHQTVIVDQLLNYVNPTLVAPGVTQFHANSIIANIQISNVLTTDNITFQVSTDNEKNGNFVNSGTAYNIGFIWDITSLEATLTPSSNISGYNSNISCNLYVPKKIRQSDFIKSVFNMYNLYVDIDPDNPNNLILITRDNYYDTGAVKDWTEKLAKDREQAITFLPELTKKKITFSYKQDSDSVNKTYFEQLNEVYGQVSFTFDNEYIKDEERKELIFSPTPILKTAFGAYVPALSGASPNTNIRILYDGDLTTSTANYTIENYVGNTETSNVYAYATHFDNPITPSFDINYGVCDYYFYSLANVTANNLYNIYYRRTINQINKGKMLSAYFDLRANDIAGLKLNDKIRIDNSWWSINSINDYKANENTLTKVELLSIDDEIDLPPYQTKPLKPYVGTNKPAKEISDNFWNNNNVINNGGIVIGSIGKQAVNGDNFFKSITTENINGIEQIQQQVFKAKITQTGTDDPVIETVYLNTLGFNITPTRTSAGNYIFDGFTNDELSAIFLATEEGDLRITEDSESRIDEGIASTFNTIPYEINTSLFKQTGHDIGVYSEDSKIFFYTTIAGTPSDGVIPSDNSRTFILTVTLYI
jgi:hypothetical protein